MFQFEELKIKQEGTWFSRKIKNKEFQKSVLFIIIGAALGAVYYVLAHKNLKTFNGDLLMKNIAVGAFFGFFITNSPCARGKC